MQYPSSDGAIYVVNLFGAGGNRSQGLSPGRGELATTARIRDVMMRVLLINCTRMAAQFFVQVMGRDRLSKPVSFVLPFFSKVGSILSFGFFEIY